MQAATPRPSLLNKSVRFGGFDHDSEFLFSVMTATDAQSSLVLACKQGDCSQVKIIVAQCNVHFGHEQALYEAVRHGHANVAQALIESGAKVEARGDVLVKMAAASGNVDILKLLGENGADVARDGGVFAVRMAASRGHMQVMQLLLAHGVDVCVNEGEALRIAAQNGHLDIVKLLIDHKADVAARSHRALVMAAGECECDGGVHCT